MAAFVEKRSPRWTGPLMAEARHTSLRYEVEDAVATITLDRPEARNALDAALKRELLAALRAAGAGPGRAGGRPHRRRRRVLRRPGPARVVGADAPPLSTVLRGPTTP